MSLSRKRSGTFAFYSFALTPYKLDVIGVTPSLGMRESEILLTYLSDNDFDNYVVFDDNKINLPHFIQTDKSKGLTEADCINALSILNTCS